MKHQKLGQLMLMLIVVLGLLTLVTGCVPNGSDKSGDNDTKTTPNTDST